MKEVDVYKYFYKNHKRVGIPQLLIVRDNKDFATYCRRSQMECAVRTVGVNKWKADLFLIYMLWETFLVLIFYYLFCFMLSWRIKQPLNLRMLYVFSFLNLSFFCICHVTYIHLCPREMRSFRYGLVDALKWFKV